MINKKVALYARVSTTECQGKQDPEMQLFHLRQYCQNRPGFTVYKEYIDRMSGARDDRPQLAMLMDDVRKRKVNVVLVWKFDRFARSTKTLILALEEFNNLNVDFISYSENLDTSTGIGKAMFTIISAFGELERSLCRQRVCAGIQKARQSGTRLGRPKVIFSLQSALSMKRGGVSWADISSKTGLSVGTLRRKVTPLLKNPDIGAPENPIEMAVV